MIMAMHDVPYMATMSPAYIPDMVRQAGEGPDRGQRIGISPCV